MTTPMTKVPRRRVILIILDGFGTNPSKANNAVLTASTPNFDRYFGRHPHTTLLASGEPVGLPDGQMGNSEVGHMTIGSGCIVRQDLVVINDSIADRSFFRNAELLAAARAAAADGRPLHLMGLVSDGGVHSHIAHLLALIKLCKRERVKPVVHMFTDGRDTPPRSALSYLACFDEALAATGGHIATLVGRYYAMDRDKRWNRIELAWRAMVDREGREVGSAREAIERAYAMDEDDEFIRPSVIAGGEAIRNGDHVVHFNFRKDRPRQLVTAFSVPQFDELDRRGVTGVKVTCMMEYDPWLGLPFAFDHDMPEVTLGGILGEAGLPQLHVAETEKYAHVTFFFNGGRGEPFPGEERLLIPSPKVATYDMQPEMSAQQVADAVVETLRSKAFAFIVVNFANGDMVGHTAVREAVIEAVEVLDREVGRVMDAAVESGYSILLSADHGNCDEMVDPVTGEPHTQHTTYPVPCLVVDEIPWRLSVSGGIKDLAPTVLSLMGLPIPPEMGGRSLLLGPISF